MYAIASKNIRTIARGFLRILCHYHPYGARVKNGQGQSSDYTHVMEDAAHQWEERNVSTNGNSEMQKASKLVMAQIIAFVVIYVKAHLL